jgi:hypothetical protein
MEKQFEWKAQKMGSILDQSLPSQPIVTGEALGAY